MSIKFESRSVNEAFARQAVGAFASQLDPTMEELGDIKTVVSEAVTNAIVHGYADRSGFITVAVRLFVDRTEIAVSRGLGNHGTARIDARAFQNAVVYGAFQSEDGAARIAYGRESS